MYLGDVQILSSNSEVQNVYASLAPPPSQSLAFREDFLEALPGPSFEARLAGNQDHRGGQGILWSLTRVHVLSHFLLFPFPSPLPPSPTSFPSPSLTPASLTPPSSFPSPPFHS